MKQISTAAIRLHHQVEIATFERPGAAVAAEYDCPIHYLGPSYLNYGYAPRFGDWLRANAPRFTAVVVNGIWQYHSYCTWRALHRSAIPYFVFTHGMLDPWFKRRYPLKHLKKSLYWPWAEYRVLRDARAVLFTSEEERELARLSFSPYRANEVVVNYGVAPATGLHDVQREIFLTQFPELRNKRMLLFLGRIHPKKGCDLLLHAFAQVARQEPTLQLVMAGPDQVGLQRHLSALGQQLGIGDAVTWAGMLTGETKMGALRCAEAFVLPSHQENFGLAVAEALACGVPVLISDKVNIWREVLADRAGLVSEDTLAGTTRLLQDWLNMNAGGRQKIASNAYRCFQDRFNSDSAARSLLSTIENRGPDRRVA